MASTPLRPAWRQRFALRKLVWVGPLTIVVAVLVNLVIRTIAVAFFGVPNGFTYLQAPFVIGSTIVFLLLALLAFILVASGALLPHADTGRPNRLISQPHHVAGWALPRSGHEPEHLLDHDRDALCLSAAHREPTDDAGRRTIVEAATKEVYHVFRAGTGLPASATSRQDCHRGQ
jgi:hypothetical protein